MTDRKEVSLVPEEVKRLNLHVPIELHKAFKAATAARGENMTDVILAAIQKYVKDHPLQPAKKGRRG